MPTAAPIVDENLRRFVKLRPETLFKTLCSTHSVRSGKIKLADREVLRAICGLVTYAGVVSGFTLNPELDGDSPLASHIARIIGASDAEEVAKAMEELCRLEMISITSDYSIRLPSVLRARLHSSAINGRLSIGRRRKNESPKQYTARAKAHRSGVIRSDLQVEVSNDLQRLDTTAVRGEALARVLRERPSGLPTDPTNPFERFEQTGALEIVPKQARDTRPALNNATLNNGAEPKLDAEIAPCSVEPPLSPTMSAAFRDLGRAMAVSRTGELVATISPDCASTSKTPKSLPKGPTARKFLSTTSISSEKQKYPDFIKKQKA